MAAAPVKSQPLHNFSFPFLKWGTTTTTTAATTNSTTTTTSTHHHNGTATTATTTEPDSDNVNSNNPSETESAPNRVPTRVGSRSSRPHRSSFASFLQKPLTKPTVLAPKPQREVTGLKQNEVLTEEQRREEEEEEDTEEEEEEEEEQEELHHHHHHQQQQQQQQQRQQQEDLQSQKPWNLRPRKAVNNTHSEAVVALPVVSGFRESNGKQHRDREGNSTMRLRGSAVVEGGGGGGEKGKENNNHNKSKKTKFWIALSREEIEEDIFSMTGSRPARRPKKRPKNVQKQLDLVFPGLWLVGATVDSYRVNDPPVKR